MTFARTIRTLAGRLVLVAAIAIGAVMFVPSLLALERYVITGKSMTGEISRGSVVWADAVPVDRLRVGDVITYQPPPDARHAGLVTHRIVSVRGSEQGPVFRTKGDFNAAADPWTFTLPQPTQARVVFDVPLAGYAVTALADRETRMLLIGIPALLIALTVLVGLVREGAAERRATARPVAL